MEHNKDLTLEYTNGEVTVTWQPNKCIHSTKCWKGLPAVFQPREKPWIKIHGADTEAIISQVKQCPSGALGFYINEKKKQTP